MATVSVSISLSFRHVCMSTVYGCACIAFRNLPLSFVRPHTFHDSSLNGCVCLCRFSSGSLFIASYTPKSHTTHNLHTHHQFVHCTYAVAPTNPIQQSDIWLELVSNNEDRTKKKYLTNPSTLCAHIDSKHCHSNI